MASIRMGFGMEARGSVGGITFSRGRAGAYIRNRVTPVNPNSILQLLARSAFATVAARWRSVLTPEQREAWNIYATNTASSNRLGETFHLSGFGWYVKNNVVRYGAGLDIIDDAPLVFGTLEPPTDVTVSGDESAATLSVAFNNTNTWATEDGGGLVVHISEPISPSITSIGNPIFRRAGIILGDTMTPPTSPQTLTPPWLLFTTFKYVARVQAVAADGRVSPLVDYVFQPVA